MQLSYSNTLFSIYGNKITHVCEPFITKICEDMKPMNFEATNQIDGNPFSMGVTLFELYIGIQEFAKYFYANLFCRPYYINL